MLSDESHRAYAVRVLEHMEPFVDARIAAFTVGEIGVLLGVITRLIDRLDSIAGDVSDERTFRNIQLSLERAAERLARRRSTA
jgi:hypothetical protein